IALGERLIVRIGVHPEVPREVEQRGVPVTWQSPQKGGGDAVAEPARESAIETVVVPAEVSPVASEQLVTADSGENDGHVLPCELRDQVGRDERSVGDGLVHVPQELGKQTRDVRFHQYLSVI